MKRIEMIKEHKEFTEIINNNFYSKNKFFNVYKREGKYNYPHFGIAVSKKLGNAVNRNLLKRRMRVIIDEWKKDLSNNEDYIIIMKENVKNLSFDEMKNSFHELMKGKEKWIIKTNY